MVLNSTSEIYGRKAPKAATFSAKSKDFKFYGLRFPFNELDDGLFLKKSSGLDNIKAGLRQLLLTNKGERVMLPNFGTNLRNYLMEPIDQALLSQIRRDILESMYNYAPNVNLLKLQVLGNDNPTLSGGHVIEVKLYCALKEDADTSFEVKVEIR